MGSVRLRKVVASDFRTFKGRHEVAFDESGVVIIDGDNRDTKGKSASGKTNLLLVISYLFDCCPLPAAALQSWESTAPFCAEAHLDTDQGPAILVRGAKGTSIKVGDEKKLTGAKAVTERLTRLCGVSGDLREILTYRDQRGPKKFLSMKDHEKKDFLVTVLGLGDLEKEVDAAVSRVSLAAKAVESTESAVFSWEAGCPFLAVPEPPAQEDESVHAAAVEMFKRRVETIGDQIDATKSDLYEVNSGLTVSAEAAQKEALKVLPGLIGKRQGITHLLKNPPENKSEKEARIREKIAQATSIIDKLRFADGERFSALMSRKAELQRKIVSLRDKLSRVEVLKSTRDQIDMQVEELAKSLCFTCGRPWDKAKQEQRELLDRVDKIDQELAVLAELRDQAQATQEEQDKLVHVPDPKVRKMEDARHELSIALATERQRLLSEEGNWRLKLEKELAQVAADISQAEARGEIAYQAVFSDPARPSALLTEQLSSLKTKLVEAVTASKDAEAALTLVRTRNAAATRSFQDAASRHTAAISQLGKLNLEQLAAKELWKVESDYLDLVRGFRNKIFDEVLERIGAEASAIVADLPNSQSISIEFRSEWTNGAGNTKSEIRPVVSIYGKERPLAWSVSGGQFTSIELAVDLAVARVISQRLGCNLNWIILDESFNGQDSITKEACLTMLQRYASDKLVIVVDHTSEFKELFQQRITVRLKDKLSTIHQETR